MTFSSATVWNLAVALLGGLAVGIEREWSGHASGPRAHFAGVRTFTMLGLVSGLSGWLWLSGLEGPAVVFLAAASALVVVAYRAASRRDVDGTTEVAALVVMAAGVLAGAGFRAAASGIIALTVLLLVEKKWLHKSVARLDIEEVRAAARFAVMAAVILPLLPAGPFGPYGGVRPRLLWAMVLFFSGLSFIGVIARRLLGQGGGYAITGVLAGVLSSTGATLTLARLSRTHAAAGRALAGGVMGANAVMFPRVLIASAVLAPALARALWPAFVIPCLIGVALLVAARGAHPGGPVERARNPLQFVAAIQMAAVFQVVLFAVAIATAHLGQTGLYGASALLGLADVDALTISTAQMTTAGTAPDITARALVVGVLANTLVKLGLAAIVGRGRFRLFAGAGLLAMAAALAAALFVR